jgi:hypothetical protein
MVGSCIPRQVDAAATAIDNSGAAQDKRGVIG